MKKISSLIIFVTCLLWYSTCYAVNVTPSNNFPNPVNVQATYSLIAGFSQAGSSQWIAPNIGTISTDANATSLSGLFTKSFPYVYNGTTWDRVYGGVITGVPLIDHSSNAAANITTSATTTVKATGGILNEMIVKTAGTTWTAAFYNIASGGCTGTPASGYQFTLQANTAGQVLTLNHTFPLGICILTAGTAGDLSVTYR